MKTAILDSVQIVEYPVGSDLEGFSVVPVWKDVDRPQTGGYHLGKNLPLAKRLKKAIESGKIWNSVPTVETDMDGNTYVCASISISMRRANSELKKLGF